MEVVDGGAVVELGGGEAYDARDRGLTRKFPDTLSVGPNELRNKENYHGKTNHAVELLVGRGMCCIGRGHPHSQHLGSVHRPPADQREPNFVSHFCGRSIALAYHFYCDSRFRLV